MKIFFPIGAFYPCQIGGQASAVLWHVTALGKQNIESSVFTTLYGIKENEVPIEQTVKTDYGNVYYSKLPFSFINLKYIYSKLKASDIVHLSGIFNIPSTLTLILWALCFRQKKLICSVHGELNPKALQFSSWKKQPTLFLYHILQKKINFHSTSPKESGEITKKFKKSAIIEIPNLMLPEEFIADLPKKNKFLFMGRIHPIKSLHKFIEALRISKLFINSDFVFDIAGTHEDRHQEYYETLQKQIKSLELSEKVLFSGHVSGKDKEKKYAESYFLVLPSETENFGNVVVEALHQNTPVMASLGTPWTALEDYQCGFHTENSPENLAKYIDKIIAMDELEYIKISQNTSKLVNDKFNITTQISKWVDIYNDLK